MAGANDKAVHVHAGAGSTGPAAEARHIVITASSALAESAALVDYWGDRADASFDPYDALLATRLPGVRTWPEGPRLALVQSMKRLPINIRPLFGISPTTNAYTVAHLASAGVALARVTGDESARPAVERRLEWLRAAVVNGGWAYPFDVQTRTYHYATTMPNVICTTFAAEALLDAIEQWPDRPDRDLALVEQAARFVVRDLCGAIDGRPRFGYLPGYTELIHNGNLLAARLVVRTGLAVGDDTLVDVGRNCAMTSVWAVSTEGALPYGRGAHLSWIDGHHTGFAIDSLADLGARLGDSYLTDVARRMADYYRRVLFSPDADPLPRPGRRWPLDVIAGAQGVTTFARLGTSNDVAFAARVADRTATRLRAPDGTYRYQRGRLHTKRVRYARWSDAPMALALALLGGRLSVADRRLGPGAGKQRKSEAAR